MALSPSGLFMLDVLAIVLPIFALVFAGWAARRSGALGPHSTSELNRFVVYLALPALLFDVVANAHWKDLWQPGFIASFGGATALLFLATVVLRRRAGHALADASIDGLNASYANTGFIGFPLAAAVLGPPSLAPTLVATLLTVCVLFAVAIVLIEIGLQSEQRLHHVLLKVARSLVRNPLLLAPSLGLIPMATGVSPPAPVEAFLKLLGGAAAPCALIALGLFLGERRNIAPGTGKSAALLGAGKLLLQPLLVWVLAVHVFALPPLLTHTAVMMAALPTGTGPFMLAEFHQREASTTAATVLGTTILSLLTITAYIASLR
ncbi:AEC family transporter [Xanthomonas euvesicatoria]